jgi:hypothetical protein
MILTTLLLGDGYFWLLAGAGPLIGALIYWMLSRPPEKAATEVVLPTPIEPDPLPVPTQRVGIPPTALVRIQEACSGLIKDGELDIRFELRSRRDCDKMLEVMRRIKENLERTKSVFNQAESGIRAQLDEPAGKNTRRLSGLFGRDAANGEQFTAAKLAELQGYGIATRLVDKFVLELGAAEASVLDLPFYANGSPESSGTESKVALRA